MSKEILKRQDVDVNRHSLRSIISRLYEEDKIDQADVQTLDDALQIRNAIVHGGRPTSSVVAKKITDTLADIINKIINNMKP